MKKSIKIVIVCLICFLLDLNVGYTKGILTLPFKTDLIKGNGFAGYEGHKGTDWICPIGTIIIAAADGVVTTKDSGVANADPAQESNDWITGGGYGNYIIINHGVVNGKTLKTHYAHLSTKFLVKDGDFVTRGQPIALSGHNGYSTEPHFHLTAVVSDIYVDPYNESSLSVDQYSLVDDNYLWTTNPPSHAGNLLAFDFPAANPQGWTTGWDTESAPQSQYNEWRIHVVNNTINPTATNPGILSPQFSSGSFFAKGTVIKLRAKVYGRSNTKENIFPELYIRHSNGNWAFNVNFGNAMVADANGNLKLGVAGTDQGFNEFTIDLSKAVCIHTSCLNIPIDNLDVTQFSLEFSNGNSGSGEYWYLDWLNIYPTSWDFTNSWLGWRTKQDANFADFFSNSYLRLNPIGIKPQIVSPQLNGIPIEYQKVGIKYSVKDVNGISGSSMTKIYFDSGSGFSDTCAKDAVIILDNSSQGVVFTIPDCARNTKQIMFELFNSSDYLNRQIAIDKIAFLKCDGTDDKVFDCAGAGGGLIDPNQPLYKLTQFISSSSISNTQPAAPLNPKTTFVKGDEVYLWFKLVNIIVPMKAKAKVYYPNGNIAFTTTWNSIPAAMTYDLWTTSTDIMNDIQCNGTDHNGRWTVEFYADAGTGYQLQNTNYFTVSLPVTIPDIALTVSTTDTNINEPFTLTWTNYGRQSYVIAEADNPSMLFGSIYGAWDPLFNTKPLPLALGVHYFRVRRASDCQWSNIVKVVVGQLNYLDLPTTIKINTPQNTTFYYPTNKTPVKLDIDYYDENGLRAVDVQVNDGDWKRMFTLYDFVNNLYLYDRSYTVDEALWAYVKGTNKLRFRVVDMLGNITNFDQILTINVVY